MGIRYYAYAFDADATEHALANPDRFLPGDPLADAWGLEPYARVSITTFEQAVPERDMLYLDKTWPYLQDVTGPSLPQARPAYRMFEGAVTMYDEGWDPWIRALAPREVVDIARDLEAITDDDVVAIVSASARFRREPDWVVEYVMTFLKRARSFVVALARDGRGMVYMIG